MKKILSFFLVLFLSAGSLPAQTAPAAPPSLQKQQVLDSVQLAYTEAGSRGAETILLIHGLGGSRQHWQQNIPSLSPEYRVLAVDLPGYGDSPLQAVPNDSLLHFFSASLLALMDSLSIPKAHLVGHSMGGQLAMLFALKNPGRVQTLLLAAPAGIETFTEAQAQGLNAYARQAYPQKLPEAQIRQNYALNFYQMPEAAEALIQERLQLNESAYFPTYAQVLIKAVEGMLQTPVADRLGALAHPVLIVFGEEDKLIPNRFLHPQLTTRAVAEKAQQAIPDSELILLPEAGHLLMVEQSEAFNQALQNFLNKSNQTN